MTALASGVALVAGGATAVAATPKVTVPSCAWNQHPTVALNNTVFIDADASYWIMSYKVQTGVSIVLKGTYPDARYMSITNYDKNTAPFSVNGVSSGITDFEIAPDAGSVNPWQQDAAAGGHYTVTLSPTVSAGTHNVLPIAPAGTADGSTGWLFYRVYNPVGGEQTLTLPSVTFVKDGTSIPVAACRGTAPRAEPAGWSSTHTAPSGTTTSAPTSTASSARPGAVGVTSQFAKGSTGTGSGLANIDNGYLSAVVRVPLAGNVVVMRAKAPTTPAGDHPLPWPSSAQTRFWSLCSYTPLPLWSVVTNRLANGSEDVGCRDDHATAVDASGYYTFVIGTEAQRAAIQTIPGVTFLPFSNLYLALPHLLVLRNLVPNFPQAVQNVPGSSSPAAAAAVMGEYYPHLAVCTLKGLAAGGPKSCIPTP